MTIFVSIVWISLGIAFLSAMVIVGDEIRHPQKMWIMNIVWPVTALYFSVFASCRLEGRNGMINAIVREVVLISVPLRVVRRWTHWAIIKGV